MNFVLLFLCTLQVPTKILLYFSFILFVLKVMPSGNGAKAAQKRERNMAKQSKQASAHSQLKDNQKAMNITCAICKVSCLQCTFLTMITCLKVSLKLI